MFQMSLYNRGVRDRNQNSEMSQEKKLESFGGLWHSVDTVSQQAEGWRQRGESDVEAGAAATGPKGTGTTPREAKDGLGWRGGAF